MPIVQASALEWKKGSLTRLKELMGILREFRKNLDKVCNSVKAVVGDVSRDANRVAREYDRALDEDDEDYEFDVDVQTSLQELPSAVDEADDAKLQAGEALDGLISHLDEILTAVKEIVPV